MLSGLVLSRAPPRVGRVEVCVLLVGLADAVMPRAAAVVLWPGVVPKSVENEACPAAGDGVPPPPVELVPKEPARLIARHAEVFQMFRGHFARAEVPEKAEVG